MVIESLSGLGEVDLFALLHPDRDDELIVPAEVTLRRWRTAIAPRADLGLRRRPGWLASGLPMELAAQDFAPLRSAFGAWAAGRYDLVWVSKAPTWLAVGGPDLGPTVVDLDDLEDQKVRAGLAADRARLDHGGRSVPHLIAAQGQGFVNARRWHRLQRRIADRARHVVLCSDLDVARSGLPRAVTIGNGYPVPDVVLGDRPAAATPSVLFAGVLYYLPNEDAARWLALEIAPALRSLSPGAVVRLVGDAHPPVRALHDPPDVEVVGWIPAMTPELARADLVAVPLRSGSGTRIKILEAFAHRIPVVSTTLGAEGLGAKHDRHLLLADDAAAFAACCARVLGDDALRAAMTTAAHELYLRSHTDVHTREGVRDLVRPLLETPR